MTSNDNIQQVQSPDTFREPNVHTSHLGHWQIVNNFSCQRKMEGHVMVAAPDKLPGNIFVVAPGRNVTCCLHTTDACSDLLCKDLCKVVLCEYWLTRARH